MKFDIVKKTLALAMVLVSIGAFASCGSKTTNNTNSSHVVNGDALINDSGTQFTPDLTIKGEIKKGTCNVDGTTVTVDGVTFDLPLKISDLLDKGFSIPYDMPDDLVAPKSPFKLIGYCFYKGDNKSFYFDRVYNDTDSEAKIEDCLITAISIYTDYNENFVLPGGITEKSTAANVLSVFGNPYDNKKFADGFNGDSALDYIDNKKSGASFRFEFYNAEYAASSMNGTDGYISYVEMKLDY